METFIVLLILLGLPALLIFIVVRGFYRKYHEWQRGRLDDAVRGISGWIVLSCILPMGKAIKGKKFKTIDWEAIKEEYKFTGHDDASEFLNKIFFKEIDAVVNPIREGETNQIAYMQSAWIQGNAKDAIPGVAAEVMEYVKSDERTESYEFIRVLGEDLYERVKRALTEKAADDALNEEYEEEVEEEAELEDEDSFYQDDSDTYVVPVPVHRSESAPRQQTRAKQHGFEIWRYYGASPLKIGERLSQSQAVQFAQQKCNDRSQPFGSSFVVREKDSGATIFSGQRVK